MKKPSKFSFVVLLMLAQWQLVAQPTITQQPADQVVTNGGTAVFNVTATGTGPLTYQWLFNDTTTASIITTVAGNGTNGFSGDGGMATNAGMSSPSGVAVDSSGNLFIADYGNSRIRKVDTNGIITTVAGNGSFGDLGDGGAARNAMLSGPLGVAMDSVGNLFISDTGNSRVRKVDTNGIITTVAGNGTSGYSGDGGAARNAMLNYPLGVAVDSVGNLFIADNGNYRIRKVDTNGIITTVAGSLSPIGVAIDSVGNLFIADHVRGLILKVDTNGIITTVAGGGTDGLGDGGAATNATLYYPNGVAVDSVGNLLIADSANNRIRKVDTNGIITTVAGNGTLGYSGDGNLPSLAMLDWPNGVAVDNAGDLFIADAGNQRIRKVFNNRISLVFTVNLSTLTLTNITTNFIGNYSVIISDSTGSITSRVATLNIPASIISQPVSQMVWFGRTVTLATTAIGTLPLSYQWTLNGTNLLDATNASYIITSAAPADSGLYAVTVTNLYGSVLSSNATLTVAYISQQPTNQAGTNGGTVSFGVVIAPPGAFTYQWQFNGVNLPTNGYIMTVAGNINYLGFSGDGGPATSANLNYPAGMAMDGAGNLFIADSSNARIRKVNTIGIITTVAGKAGSGYSGDGGAATNATLSYPSDVALDSVGNLFIADAGTNRIRKVGTNGIITTVAGNGTAGYSGDGGVATSAKLNGPPGVAVDSVGNLFIADGGNYRIRKLDTNGIITTVAGNGSAGYSGDAGAATNAMLYYPEGVAVDKAGNMFIADYYNNRIRKVDTNGIITTVAGNGTTNFFGDGGQAISASLWWPVGVAVDRAGNLFIADFWNNRIREVWANGIITTVAGNGTANGSDGGPATSAALYRPRGVTVDSGGDLYVSDSGRVHKVVGNPTYCPISPTLILGNLSATNAGNYSVIIRNASGSITSAVVTLTVQAPPVITVQPASRIVGVGSSPNFSVAVLGSGPFGYAWYFAGTNLIQSGTNNIFSLTGVSSNNSGNYTVVITNAYGSVTSQVATLTVVLSPTVATPPVSQTNWAGTTVNFSVTAGGVGPFSYQWQFNGTNIPNNLITTVAGNGTNSYSGDGGAATNASLYYPRGLAFDAIGNLYIADANNNRIRKVDTNGIITTVAGKSGASYSGDGGFATNAMLYSPAGVAFDASGNLFIDDQGNHCIRKVATNGIISSVTGTTNLGNPSSVVLDTAGNLYISDSGSNVIRKVESSGIFTIVVGNGYQNYSGDGGAATNASLNFPVGMAFDAFGNFLIADKSNNRIRKVDTNGIITTVAGKNTVVYAGDGGAATNAGLYGPQEVALDATGNLFISDYGHYRIRKVDTNGIITTVAGNGTNGFSGDGGAATNASFVLPMGMAFDASGNMFIADSGTNRIREIHFGGYPTLLLTNVNAANAGNYSVVISSPYGSVTSSIASLIVHTPPFISVQPTNQTRAIGGTANFNVTAGGDSPLSYQWYFRNPSLQTPAGATALTYYGFTVAALVTNGGSGYTTVPQVQVIGGGGSGAGGYATLSNGIVIAVTMTNAGFGYTSLPAIQIDPPNGLLIGQTGPVLNLNAVTTNNAGNYFVTVTNNYGSVTSSLAGLVLFLPPQGFQGSITAGNQLALQLTGSPSYPYILLWATNLIPPIQWQPVATNPADGNGNWSFTITNLPALPAGFYRAAGQ